MLGLNNCRFCFIVHSSSFFAILEVKFSLLGLRDRIGHTVARLVNDRFWASPRKAHWGLGHLCLLALLFLIKTTKLESIGQPLTYKCVHPFSLIEFHGHVFKSLVIIIWLWMYKVTLNSHALSLRFQLSQLCVHDS